MDKNQRIKEIEKRLIQIESEKYFLQQELNGLKCDSNESKNIICRKNTRKSCPVTKEDKINLFISLFACRQDVYPKLWENKRKNRKGYSPVCKNEWINGICKKPNIKCSNCPDRSFSPMDSNVVKSHLLGKITIGTYTIRNDDTCIFLAADFDKQSWKDDVLAYKSAGEELSVPVYLERSRSGNGAHAWIFFAENISAKQARQLGSIILARAMLNQHTLTLESYDRFFPNQDYLPKGGFGNLIALPLQGIPRNKGNTVFVNDSFIPFENQWEYLSGIVKLSQNEVDNITATFSNNYDISNTHITEDTDITNAEVTINVDSNDLTDCYRNRVDIIINSTIEIDIKGMPSILVTALKRMVTFANPKYFELQKLRFSTWNTPKYIFCGEYEASKLRLPKGTLENVIEVFNKAGSIVSIQDNRFVKELINLNFQGVLKPEQEIAVNEILKNDYGVLVAPTGSGKTVIACKIISQREKSTLILVHRKQLVEQWQNQLTNFLGISKKKIGTIGGGKKKITGHVDIAMIQTLLKMEDELYSISNLYEQIIIDECHHIPAVTFESVLNKFSNRYCLGLTATPYRKDGHQPILYMQCGSICYEIKENEVSNVIRKVIIKTTTFRLPPESGQQPAIHEIWNHLAEDKDRLQLIAVDILSLLNEKRFILTLSERKDHLINIIKALKEISGNTFNLFLLTGDAGKKKRKQILKAVQNCIIQDIPFCIFSTGSLIGEGFDLPALNTLILAMPISFKGRIIQYAGRIHREHKMKQDVLIYDYLDTSTGLTISMFQKRVRTYKKMGYEIDVVNNPKILKYT